VGKRYRIIGVRYHDNNVSRAGFGDVGHATNEVLADNTATAPVGIVAYTSGSAASSTYSGPTGTTTQMDEVIVPENFIVPAGNYPFCQGTDFGDFRVYGLEEDL
jgi:hypothetical protein